MAQLSDGLGAGCLVISPQAPLQHEDTPSQWGRGAESWHPEAAHQPPQAHPCSRPQQRAGHLSHPGAAAKDPLGPGRSGRALETMAGSPPLWRSPPAPPSIGTASEEGWVEPPGSLPGQLGPPGLGKALCTLPPKRPAAEPGRRPSPGVLQGGGGVESFHAPQGSQPSFPGCHSVSSSAPLLHLTTGACSLQSKVLKLQGAE